MGLKWIQIRTGDTLFICFLCVCLFLFERSTQHLVEPGVLRVWDSMGRTMKVGGQIYTKVNKVQNHQNAFVIGLNQPNVILSTAKMKTARLTVRLRLTQGYRSDVAEVKEPS